MPATVLEKFLNNNEMLLDAPVACDLEIGTLVTYTNDQGVSFPNLYVIGFCHPENGRFIHISSDAAWFPVTRESLTIQGSDRRRDVTVKYKNGEIREFKSPDVVP